MNCGVCGRTLGTDGDTDYASITTGFSETRYCHPRDATEPTCYMRYAMTPHSVFAAMLFRDMEDAIKKGDI